MQCLRTGRLQIRPVATTACRTSHAERKRRSRCHLEDLFWSIRHYHRFQDGDWCCQITWCHGYGSRQQSSSHAQNIGLFLAPWAPPLPIRGKERLFESWHDVPHLSLLSPDRQESELLLAWNSFQSKERRLEGESQRRETWWVCQWHAGEIEKE